MRTPALALLALLPLAGACSSNRGVELSKDEQLGIYIENALRYFELHDLDRTEHQCLRALQLDPGNERFLLMLGKVYLLKGQTEDILRALAIFDDHPGQHDYRIHIGKGEAHERLSILKEDAAEAIASGERYTEGDPAQRAEQLRTSAGEHLDTAVKAYLRAEQIHDGELNAVNGLIRTYALTGDYTESIRWSRILIDVLAQSSRLRRVELEDVGIRASRERELTASVRRNTEMTIKTHFHVASVLRELGRKQEAADELGRIVSLDPEKSEAFSRRAQLYFELGQFLKSRESVEEFINLEAKRPFEDPDIRAAYDLMARCDAALEGSRTAGG